jgi:predicted nucleotidyltransferase
MMLPTTVEKTMGLLCNALEARMPGWIESVYVYGSVALGAYVEHSSDIDFIAIVRGRPDSGHIRMMEEAHEELERAMPGSDIMGAYLTREQLGKPAAEIGAVPAYFEKKLHNDGKGTDLNPVTWWILKRNGIRVYGREIPFAYETPAESLIDYVIRNMNSYWLGWVNRLAARLDATDLSERDISAGMIDKAVEWCSLGMLRQLYTIRERDVTSKLGAGEFGLRVMPEHWHPLIREAMAVKRGEPERHYASQRDRLRELVELLRHIHAECNRGI